MRDKTASCAALWLLTLTAALTVLIATGTAAALGAAALLVAIPALSLAANLYVRRRLTVRIMLPASAPKQSDAVCMLTLCNDSHLPVVRAVLRLRVKNELTDEERRERIALSAAPKSNGRAELLLRSGYCGRVSVQVEKACVADWFGMLPIPFAAACEASYTSLPQTFAPEVQLSVCALRPEDSDTYAPDRRGADASETFQLRDYVPGDSLRQIHWKLSGKLDRPVVREASFPVSRSLLIFWDKSAAAASAAEMDAMAEVVISVCQTLSEKGQPYTLGWDDEAGAGCVVEAVENTDGLLRTLPRLLRNGGATEMSGTVRYLRQYGPAQYGKILYIAAESPAEAADFFGRSDAVELLCAPHAPVGPARAILFRPESYTQTLQILELNT